MCVQEWPAFYALKKTIDDFNDMCPLLELMANKAMKPRHWQRIMEVIGFVFDLESEGFCLKNILEAPLLKYKEDIEVKICVFIRHHFLIIIYKNEYAINLLSNYVIICFLISHFLNGEKDFLVVFQFFISYIFRLEIYIAVLFFKQLELIDSN